ncbi:cytochrome family protein [Bradyrhizobium erythrophlei]|jgi:hypothetical protein|uniref:Cytochrome C n=1 Tax=Bradyrhizobium erythrophlei TaxID=1437360 RepID=A0A1M5YX54_9BRAD|nr:cytochrome family protein [Bradyrhizobium erythrophlei]SHI16629.1 hypothetical protein SAMN05443248_8922 [Bradyrhizobium erythrophlei]
MIGALRASTKLRTVALLGIPSAITLCIGLVASHTEAAEPDATPPSQANQYLPPISDLMIATIQPRHRRLWQAAQEKNWAFAAYELGNLRAAFKRLGEAYPTEHDIPFPDMISSVTEQPLEEINTAIEAKDEVGFTKAYADLTTACNACHQALNYGVVVIRTPSGKSDSDQDFTTTEP